MESHKKQDTGEKGLTKKQILACLEASKKISEQWAEGGSDGR